jgi:KDO2-lipid IV(A) lauroyltransferase
VIGADDEHVHRHIMRLLMPRQPPSGRTRRLALELRYRTEMAAVHMLSGVACALPPRVRLRLGGALGRLAWLVDGRHRRVTLDNLRHAFGETRSPRDMRRLGAASLAHLGRLAVEVLAFPTYRRTIIGTQLRIDGIEHLHGAQAKGKGVIGFTGHFGNWELATLGLGYLGCPFAGIARRFDNPYLDQWMTRRRTLTGGTVIPKRQAVGAALRVLREQGRVGVLIDQRPKHPAVQVPFFGRPAHTIELVAILALRMAAPILPFFVVLEPAGTWRLVFEPEVPVVVTGDRQADVYRITADCTAILERWVRKYPEQWLWAHNRWREPGAPPLPGL